MCESMNSVLLWGWGSRCSGWLCMSCFFAAFLCCSVLHSFLTIISNYLAMIFTTAAATTLHSFISFNSLDFSRILQPLEWKCVIFRSYGIRGCYIPGLGKVGAIVLTWFAGMAHVSSIYTPFSWRRYFLSPVALHSMYDPSSASTESNTTLLPA